MMHFTRPEQESDDFDSEFMSQIKDAKTLTGIFDWAQMNDPERYRNLVSLFDRCSEMIEVFKAAEVK